MRAANVGYESLLPPDQMASNSLTKTARELERAQAVSDREKARRLKEEEKNLAWDAANAELVAFEHEIAALTGAHKVQPRFFNWDTHHFSLPPHPPAFHSKNHLREVVETILLTREYDQMEERLSAAWGKDQQAYYENCSAYEDQNRRWARLKSVALRLQAGDASSLVEAHSELEAQGFTDSTMAGLVMQPCDARRLYVALRVASRSIVPEELKTLTQSGKVSTKSMPKNRAREIYEDYVCGRCIAVARRLFATLPLEEVILTVYIPKNNMPSGHESDIPVVSVHFNKDRFVALNFNELDPSDALQSFRHAGDVRASKRGEDFMPVRPLAFETPNLRGSSADGVQSLAGTITRLRMEFSKFQTKDKRTSMVAAEKE